jgi:acetyl-CoA acyltransferase
VRPLARLLSYAAVALEPRRMAEAPAAAAECALSRAEISLASLERVEINEAFAAVGIASTRSLGISEDIVNVNGGAIALGHPLGATGAKLTATLLHELRRREGRYGVVSMCIAGGQGAAAVFERV